VQGLLPPSDNSIAVNNNNNNNNNNLAKTITDKQNKYQELANEISFYVEAKRSSSDADRNIIYGSNSKVTITKSKKTQLASRYIYIYIYIYIQKSVILGTCLTVRKVLNYK
jgi:hypothetical protein